MAGATEATRAGFAWIEFRRGDETFTIGARIRASHATHRAERQLFTTTLWVGDELHLLDSRRGAISRRELTDAVGATGRVTESATEHRDAVRRVLFPTFGVERYDSLIGALLSLRREKLSQNLDLAKLSAVLSEALPPLDDHDIAEVAEGFERLDRRRHEIELLATDLEQVDALVQRQRRYARSVLAGVAGEVVSAESARDTVVRDRRLAGAELDALDTELATLVAEDESLRRRVTDIDDELRGIRESALYREGAQLAELRGELKKRSEERDGLAHSVERLAEGLGEAIAERDRADEDVATAAANLDRAWAALAVLADRVGARSVVPPEGAPSGGPSPADHRAALAAWVADRHSAVESVGDALTAHEQAVRDHRGAEDRLDAARQRSEQRTVERDVRVRAASEAVEVYVGSVGSWAEDTVLTGDERLAIDAARHGEDPPDEVDAAVALLRGDRREAAAVAHRDLAARREVVQEERSRLVAERDTLEAGVAPTPVAPPWRRHRDAVGGGPLWRLVDVIDGVPGPVVDAVESAMVAAGLADAWVVPDGSIELGPDDADVVLTAAGPSAEAAGTLAEVLTPVIGTLDEAPVPAVVVAGVLRSIRLVADPVTLGGDDVAIGRNAMYRLGAAVGRGRRVTATLFGATARERHRLAEIDRLSGEIVTSDQVLADVEHRDRAVAAGLAAFEAVMADRPPRRQVDDARSASREAETRLDEATRRAEDARAEVVEAETAVRSAQRRLATECSRTGLPGRRAELDEYRAEVDLLDEGAGTWSRRAEEASTAAEALARTDRSAQRAAGAHADGAERWRQVDLEARSLTTRVAAISSSLGSDLDDLLAMGEVLVDERGSGTDRLDEIRVVRPPLDVRRGELRQGVVEAETALSEVEARRSRAHGGVTRLASGPLLADAAVDVGVTALEGVTAVLAAARAIASAVASDPADQVDRRSRAVEELLHTVRTLLAGRIDLAREQPDGADWLVLMGSSGGVRRTLGDLVARLMLDLGAARSELAAEEAELFERTLAGSIRSSLAERIRAANALVDTINARLDEVRTAAGVGVRLRWAVDDEQPPAVRAARSLLLRDPADLSDEERGALSDFVRARVDEARRDVEVHAPWELRLRESLDYRQWHSFGLQVSHRDWQGFKPATGNLLQRLSTGERSVALHLPMLASIAAHYADGQGGHLDGPRLILLDELFAGVDESNRAQLFGTFTAWDLDAVLTSDHEWCQYSTLAGIAIHHLQGGRDDEPVTSVRFVWDGRERVLDAGTGSRGGASVPLAGRPARSPGVAPLVDELVRRLEVGPPPVRITVPALSDVGERTLADLLGLDHHLGRGGRAGATRSLAVERLTGAFGADVRAVVEELRGPLGDRRAERTADEAGREALWRWLGSCVAELRLFPEPARGRDWVARVRRTGVPDGDLAAHRTRLEVVLRVLRRLPTEGMALASLAADVTGDAHVLDRDRRVGRFVVDALSMAGGIEPPSDGAALRELWEQVGVMADPLSSTVLVLGLRSGGDGPLASFLGAAADAGEPVVLSLSQLVRWPILPPPGTPSVFVVENPAVMAEAAVAGTTAPILCTGGWPSVAALTLLGGLRAAGVVVHQHADLDPAGLRITAWLAARHGTTPWQMAAAAYRQALELVPESPRLTATVPDTPWDPALAQLMRRAGRAIHEESIREILLASMRRTSEAPL